MTIRDDNRSSIHPGASAATRRRPACASAFVFALWLAFGRYGQVKLGLPYRRCRLPAPLMGLFFGRISRGRTIRQTVIGIMGWGSLGCLSFMSVCGAYALTLAKPVVALRMNDASDTEVVALDASAV